MEKEIMRMRDNIIKRVTLNTKKRVLDFCEMKQTIESFINMKKEGLLPSDL
jgi:hypothetical protein